jgi:hypothetical protein
MKKKNTLLAIGILLLSTVIMFSSCKKKSTTPEVSAPTFVATSQPNGADYFDIYLKCTSNDILLTKVIIKDPFSNTYTYTGNQQLWVKDEIITFPDSYPKSSGTWILSIYGNRTDNSSFVSTCTLLIAGK